MLYFYFIWNSELKKYIPREISYEEACLKLKHYYRTTFVRKLQGKMFRLRTPIGWIETQNEDGLRPMPNFYGICE